MTVENPFGSLKREKGKRGKGLKDDPPQPQEAGKNVGQSEETPAVSVTPESVRRQYRISTYINDEAGERLENLIIKIRKLKGKKPKIAEVIEQGLEALEENVKTLKR